MKYQLQFHYLFGGWIILATILFAINEVFINSSIFSILIKASLGIIFIIYPIYPKRFEYFWEKNTCRNIIRLLATLEILASTLVLNKF